jgi:pimeloyl-ACP methyl ester carboxylesterase
VPTATIAGVQLGYDLIGDGPAWVITPGGRFDRGDPGVRELAEAIAAAGNQVLTWDRPNCGESEVCFAGESESHMQAEALTGLLRHLGLAPAIAAGGSGGARVSLLAALRDPAAFRGLALWWISGGAYGLLSLAVAYCGDALVAAWRDGMEAVADLPMWRDAVRRNPSNRARIVETPREEFIATMERWMTAYCPRAGDVGGVPAELLAALRVPALVLRSGASDPNHPRATSEALAATLPDARLAEPPWGDGEFAARLAGRAGGASVCERWPLLAPVLTSWASELAV